MAVKVTGVLLVLGLVLSAASGQIVIAGIVRTGSHAVALDTVTMRVAESTFVFETIGWGGPAETEDTFHFDPAEEWPGIIKVKYDVDGRPGWLTIEEPVEDSWYALPSQPEEALVKFLTGVGVAEAGARPGLKPELAVAPTTLTSRVLIEAGPVPGSNAFVEVLDACGVRVRGFGAVGEHGFRAYWRGTDDEGNRLAEGIYFVRLACEDRSTVRKVILAR